MEPDTLATTPGGLPYPLPTDPLTDGANAIKNLALAMDAKLNLIFDVVVGRGNPGDPAAPAATIDSQTILTALGIAGGLIPQTFRHLLLSFNLRGDGGSSSAAYMRVNNDVTPANYTSAIWMGGTGAAPTGSATPATASGIPITVDMPSAAEPAGRSVAGEIEIDGYSRAQFNKSYHGRAYSSGSGRITVIGGTWIPLAAITRLAFTPASGNFAAGSQITLRGI